jgi:RHS repeat-associated protein
MNNENPNRGSVRVRRPGVALVSMIGLVLGTLAVANPLSLDVIKHGPLGVLVESAASLPAEVQALEQQTAGHVFDRDTSTEHTIYDASQITAELEAATEVSDIKVFGAAPYTLSVQAEVNGGWQPVSGLQNLNLANRADVWSTFSASTPVTTSKLAFQLVPVTGSSATGLKAIEIWGKGSRTNVNGGLALLTALRGTTPPSQGRLIAAAPEQGVIGGTTDDPSDNTFTFTLDHDPAQLKRAYLAYEVLGLSHWVGAVRSLNGQAALGGFTMQPGSDWVTQVEPVDPAAFERGENRVAFSVPAGAASSYTVRKVYLVAELESGANFVVSSAANQPEDGNPPGDLLDGDLTTGWTPYPAANVLADVPTLTLGFDKPTQVDGVSLYLVNKLKGSVAVEVLRDKVWSAPVASVADALTLAAGWNSIALSAGAPADSVRLVFTGGVGSSADLKELQVIGSGVGPASMPRFTVAYPDAGQFYGRTAYIRGFLQPAANASGAAQIFAGDVTVPASDGAFELAISKNDVGLESQGDTDAWSVDLRAVYPDGTTIVSTIALDNPQPAVESADGKLLPTYKFAVAPGQAKKLAYDAASLDLPADAVGSEINIGITPLRAEDLPALDAGMTNVTKGPRHGYRFTPTPMKFKNKIKVTLPYSKASIPAGHTEQDVRTYYFDTQAGSWKVLERVAVDAQTETVTSYTDHFTDMINATVTVPDHPQGVSFNPTLIKDIKAADPGAQVNLIAPPEANNMGDARLAYPLEVPPGRQGMQPQLAVQYNSSGGNGWMGMGWDIPMQAVTIDTRWGVPRYQTDKETETYLLNGEQLTPVAHRGELQPRSAEKVFHTRVEGQFRRIVRHGDHPNNYWWEVTDKNGTRFIYGADPVTQQRNEESTLTDGKGNGFLWTLREMRDTNDNFVRYHYAPVGDTGVSDGKVMGSNLYLKKITYTGHGTEEGAYAVTFERDRDLGEALRTDKQIDARGAFKRVTADRLRKVSVSFNGLPVRAYAFEYAEGAFHKTLLQRAVQYDEDGREFNRHEFGYYDEARDGDGTYKGFAETANWDAGGDNVSAGLMGEGAASALGGSEGQGAGGHLYVGIGPKGETTSKSMTGGIKLGFNRSTSETLLAMADMNGDGLPDKVFKGGGGFHYRPNLSGPGRAAGFGEPVVLPTLPAIGHEEVTSTTLGIETYFVLTTQRDYSVSETETSVYFSDVNGDGLTDLVSGGQVLFGYRNAAGVPTFSGDSQDTPVPIGTGSILTDNLLEDAAAVEAKRAADFPLMDSMRRWVAPYDGVIAVDAPVHLIKDISPARDEYTGADGVRVAIQLEGAELWSERIQATDYGSHTPAGVGSITVHKGDRLYFRVQSVFDGAYDQVAWDPEITYLSADAGRTDVNGLAEYRYTASNDFTLAGRRGTVTVPLTGTLHLGGTWYKTGATTDDVTLLITRNGAEVYRRTLGFAGTETVTLSQHIAVTAEDQLEWRIVVDSPIDASRIRLEPTAYYTAAEGVDAVKDDNGNYVIHVTPPFDMDLYPVSNLAAPQAHYAAPNTGSLPVTARLGFVDLKDGETAEAVLTVKRRGALLAKQAVLVTGTGSPIETELTLNVPVTAGDQLFFDATSRQTNFLEHLGTLEVTTGIAPAGTALPVAVHVRAAEELFPQPYRGWGAAGYNGNGERADKPIDQSRLALDKAIDQSLLNKAVSDGTYTSESAKAFAFIPQQGEPFVYPADTSDPATAVSLWGGVDELAWVKPGEMSASRLGLDDIRAPDGSAFAGASAVSRISESTNDAHSVGGGVGGGDNAGASGSANVSEGDSRSLLDFQDLNGDRFPDVLGNGGTQFSSMTGGLEATTRNNGVGNARKNNNVSYGGSVGGTIPVSIGNGSGNVDTSGQKTAQTGLHGNEMPSLGFGGDLGGGTSDTEYDLIDINGDGLPDRVYEDGTAKLNLGYEFAEPAEPWAGGVINDGDTVNAGVNMGYNSDFYSLGGGLNLGTGTSKTDETYADLNGDGLPDKVIAGSPLKVRLNTGAGFAAPIDWRGGHGKVAVDKHISLGGGVYFTFGFEIYYVRIVINPGVNFSTTMGRPEVAFRDVDGDGYADHLYSEKDSELQVAANPIGRTNLLKSVSRPLGAKIDIEYGRDGNTYELPQSRWVMNKVSVFDGHPGDGVDTLVNTYQYEGGIYDRLERDFYGYGRVVQEQRNADAANAVYRTVTQDFHTDSYYTKGLVKHELTADGAGRSFLETANSYELKTVHADETADAKSTSATLFPALVRTDRSFYEGQANAALSTHTTHEYDALGNVVHFTDTGNAGAGDDVEAYIRYSSADPGCVDRHIVGIPLGIDVIGDGRLMRSRSSRIDCTSGDITEVSRSLENGQASVTDLAYDRYGNLARVTGPANHVGQRYALDYGYDPVISTHVTRISDSFGYSSTASHTYKYGKVETTTDLNGQQTTYVYDKVGRPVTLTGPYEQGSGQATIRFDYHPEAAVPYALTQHVDRDAGGAARDPIETLLFTDGIKRVVQTKKDIALHTGAGRAPIDSMSVSGRVVFDFAGRAIEQYYPVSEAKGLNTAFNPAFDAIPPTRTEYDVLDRSVRTTMPDRTVTTMQYGFGSDRFGQTRFETVVTDANGKQKKSYRDVRELITAVQEFNPAGGQPVIWTSYGYDALKQIVEVVDDRSNTTRVTYDNFGRRTVIDNPDTGRTETVYDLADNPTAKITANLKGRQVSYAYDYNRLKSISYPDFPGNNVAYYYGAPGALENAASRIVKVTSEAGTETRGYGPLGELVRQTWDIASDTKGNSPNSPEVYTTTYRFDTWNRLMQMSYPDGEVLTYHYDSGGLVDAAAGVKSGVRSDYLKRLEYDKFEQRAYLELGNGIKTAYAYDPLTRRLCALNTAKDAQPTACRDFASAPDTAPGLQALVYQYDAVGNILGLRNTVAVPPASQFGGPVKQSFAYDDLYRLTQAEGSYHVSPNTQRDYQLEMAYDSIHNIRSKQQADRVTHPGGAPITQKKTSYAWNYDYAPSGPASVRPHAPIHIGERTYSYDANGNQTGWDNDNNGTKRTIVWDEENRIQSVKDNGHEQSYWYDDAGERVIKRGPQGETVYVNQWYTIRDRSVATKHVFIGSSRIASRLVPGSASGGTPSSVTTTTAPTFPGQGLEHRSETADLHAQNTVQNPHFSGSTTTTTTTGTLPTRDNFLYYYHPDHLGSTSHVTDADGKLFEHIEYFPFGESWVEESSNTQRTPYLFTGKELDEETGLYYFGARYYDARTSVWQSVDPIVGKYLSGLPAGGVYRSVNLSLYSYVSLNPTKYKDPDGLWGRVGHQYTPQAAALAAGVPALIATEFGRAAQAPDQPGETRDAMSKTSLVDQFGSFDNQEHIHNLNGRDAARVQGDARFRFAWFVRTADLSKQIDSKGENIMHAFGDSYGHVRTDGSGRMYSSGFGHAVDSLRDMARGAVGLPPALDPDNPYSNSAQYRSYMGALYDVFSKRAQKEGWKARMGRQEFVDHMMRNVAALPDPSAQERAVERVVKDLESR